MAQRILDYLKERPEACDTLEGIAKWWLLSQQLTDSINAVHQALTQLKARGDIAERQGADNRTLYFARSVEGPQ